MVWMIFGYILGKYHGKIPGVKPNLKRLTHFKELHFHHSLLGLVLIILGIVFSKKMLTLFGFGLFFQHAVDEGLVFITKD